MFLTGPARIDNPTTIFSRRPVPLRAHQSSIHLSLTNASVFIVYRFTFLSDRGFIFIYIYIF